MIAGHSWDIIDVLNDSWKQVQTELDDTHHSESNAAHDFTMRKHSPEDQRFEDTKRLQKEKSENTEFATALAAEKVDLTEAEKRLASEKTSQAASTSTCSQVATVHEVSVKAFAEELKALLDATRAIRDQTYPQFHESSSPICERSQTPSIRSGDNGGKAHSKRTDEIQPREQRESTTNLTNRLQTKASSEASHKPYCDEETAEASTRQAREARLPKRDDDSLESFKETVHGTIKLL